MQQFSQEQLLKFMTKVISLVERRHYSLRNVFLCSKYNHLLKNEIVVGYMDIIADDAYWQLIDQEFQPNTHYTDWQYYDNATHSKSALFLKYTNESFGDKKKYKNIPDKATERKVGSNIDAFPYLIEAISKLENNASEIERYDDEIINATLMEIKKDIMSANKKESSPATTKELVKKLNEVKEFRHYYDGGLCF